MTDLDDSAAVDAAKEAIKPDDAHSNFDAIVLVLPEVISEFCAIVVVPTLNRLLLPTIALIDHSPADHAAETQALRHLPQALSTVIQSIGADHFALLLGAHLVNTAVDAAHAAAVGDDEEDDGVPLSSATLDYVDAVLRESLPQRPEESVVVTSPWEVPEPGDVPPVGEPIAPVPTIEQMNADLVQRAAEMEADNLVGANEAIEATRAATAPAEAPTPEPTAV